MTVGSWTTGHIHTARVEAYKRIARLVGVEARSDCYVQGEADAVVQAVERATSDWTHRATDSYARVCAALGVVRADGTPGDVDVVLARIATLQRRAARVDEHERLAGAVIAAARARLGHCECDWEVTGHTGACRDLAVALSRWDREEP